MSSLKVDGRPDADARGLEQARRLVQSIFRQITEGDAPSANFESYEAVHGLGGSSGHGGAPRRDGGGGKRPASSASARGVVGDGRSQSGGHDAESAAASESSASSTGGASPFSSPFSSPKLPASKFPPRPPSSASQRSSPGDAGNHSTGDRPSAGAHLAASPYGIGSSLMGTLALADLCSRTIYEVSGNKEAEKKVKSCGNGQFFPGALPPPPLTPGSEESSPHGSRAQALVSIDRDETRSGHSESQERGQCPPRKVLNGDNDALSFATKTACDDQGFPCDNDAGAKSNDGDQKDIARVDTWDKLTTDTSWKTESDAFGKGERNGVEERAAASKQCESLAIAAVAPPDAARAARSHRSASPLAVQRSLSSDCDSERVGRRITMFGSEYARILSSSKPAPTPHGIPHPFRSASKVKRSSSAVSSKIKARFSSSSSVAQSYASTSKESVESGGRVLLSLDDCPNSVATAAITDVIVTSGSDVPPRGYYRAFQLGEESLKNMVPGRKRLRLYLNVKKEPNWDRAVQRPCVTAFCVIYPDRNEFVPPGFSVVRHHQLSGSNEGGKKKEGSSKNDNGDQLGSSASPPANLNLSFSGERVYMCYRRSREGNPITGVTCLRPSKGDIVPEGYTVLERSPRNYLADMAAKSEQPLFLAYRQRLENLECLRPFPLVSSVLNSRTDAGRRELKAYYCTGGSVVPSEVGRYHVMDRSTHSLLSSSSAQSRLNLIQSSRNGSETAVPAWVTPSRSSNRKIRSASSVESPSQRDDSSAADSFDTRLSKTPSQGSLASQAASSASQQSPTLTKSTSPAHSLFSHSDDTLQTSFDAMHFIPPIECASSLFQDEDSAHSASLFQTRLSVITPILTSCYTSQGGSALLAVEGLISLLNNTHFFAQDVAGEPGNVGDIVGSSVRLTVLDLAVQVVCDVATQSARETYFRSCVDFVESAVRYARGFLNDRTLGFVLRFYLFVFYFGCSTPSGGWPFNKHWQGSDAGILDDFLLSDNVEQNTGGAPQAAALSLKEFITIMLSRIETGLGKVRCQYYITEDADESASEVYAFARNILSSLMENAMNRVDIANYTQLAIYQIHRSGGSELFWHDMINGIGEGLFGLDPLENSLQHQGVVHSNIVSFAVLASLVKISSANIRMVSSTEPVPRDVASKLLSLELLSHFIKMWHAALSAAEIISGTEEGKHMKGASTMIHTELESAATMIYVVRRLVVPSLLSNTSAAIEDIRVYRRVLRIISQLWCNAYYRRQMKIDLAVLIEHFVLKLLCLGPQVNQTKRSSGGDMPNLLYQQMDLLDEMKIWFTGDSKNAIDLFIDYDTQVDMLPAAYCKLMNKICEALSTLAEESVAIISEQGRFASINGGNGSPRKSAIFPRDTDAMPTAHVREAAQSLREKSFSAITAIAKSMMDCAAMCRKEHEALELANSYESDKSPTFDADTFGLSPQISPVPSPGDENIVDYWKTSIEKRRAPLLPSIWPTSSREEIESNYSFNIKESMSEDSSKQAQLQLKQESFDVAFELISTKGLKKGIDYLIACHLLTPSPRHISAFLRIHQSSIDPAVLGEYLGEGGIDGTDKDFWNLIRFNFARATSFVGMNIEQALRHFLTNCGFRLPGEAQKIDRIISTFSQCYWEDNAGDLQKCPFQDQDMVFLVSFAIM
ncbi:hypothetical protein ACHAWF_013593 [Thalassiosira exigua]